MIFIIYTNYGPLGMQFQTGPANKRWRVGLWSHIYRRRHGSECGGCPQCLERVALGPVSELPQGRKTGIMYRMV